MKNIHRTVISVHCHNDLGLAAANALAAIQAGARQVECTVNGIGERAGNTSLEEIDGSQDAREHLQRQYRHQHETDHGDIQAPHAYHRRFGAPNKAIVGANAFAHESGIHQDGVLKNAMTYE